MDNDPVVEPTTTRDPLVATWLVRVSLRGPEGTEEPTNAAVEELAAGALAQLGEVRVVAERVDR
jgi:hypothetical protein